MEERIRLYNPHKFNVGIVTPDKEHGLNIAPGSFTIVNQDELDYLIATTTLLKDGVLRVKEEEQKEHVEEMLGMKTDDNANFMSDEDIKKKLSGNVNQLKKWLNSDEIQPYVLERIADIAKGMNLSMNKIQVLKERIPKYDFLK